jgi:hypothetical protein
MAEAATEGYLRAMRAGRVVRWIGGFGGALALAVVPFGAVGAAPATTSRSEAAVVAGPDGPGEPLPQLQEHAEELDSALEVVESPSEATEAAVEAIEAAPPGALQGCAPDEPGDPCVRVRPVGGEAVAEVHAGREAEPAPALRSSATIETEPSPFGSSADTWTPLCTGNGSDGFRVQAVYAYAQSQGPPSTPYTDAVKRAVANTDLTFSRSASATGGSRRVRFVTTSGAGGCQVDLVKAPVSSGLASFDALVNELVAAGRISGDEEKGWKYLIWTEGDLVPSVPSACGIGLSYSDDVPGTWDNYNALTSYAAVKAPCWDIDGGGSVPAHELMHTLGAVQDSAPHYDGRGHCTDDHDNMCYGSSTVVVPGCTDYALEALFDCNHDDYFHTSPAAGSYLCRSWNTARSPYLLGYDSATGALGAIPAVWATPSQNRLQIQWSPPNSCPSASAYRIEVSGWGSDVVLSDVLSYTVDVPPGDRTITVTPYRDGQWWPSLARSIVASSVAVANSLPVGGMVLSLNQGSNYGLLAWAIDPETGAPPRMRVTVEGVSSREYDWNYTWADMPAFTGVNDTRSLVFLAQLPSGTRRVCFDALDPQGGGWTNLGCTTHTVK